MQKPIFQSVDQLFTIYQGDCNDFLPFFENQFDLIFADPPYFLSNNGLSIQNGKITSVNKGEWDKEANINDIDEFNEQWIKNAKKSLKDNGTILISGTYHNIFSLGRILQKLDFKILNIITWQKTNPPPNFSCRYLTHSAEQIIWARKSEKHPHFFNYELLKKINDDRQMRDIWTFPAIAPWEKTQGKHPTQKPLKLLVRLILMSTDKNAKVADPFAGSASTGIAANLLGRSFVGFEKESDFINLAMARKKELEKNLLFFKNKIEDLKFLNSFLLERN